MTKHTKSTPRARRMFLNRSVYFVTNRTAEGLPFVPNAYINALLKGVLARAMHKYPGVVVSHFLFLPNHYHGVLVTKEEPSEIRNFMNYVDGELAKLIARILNKRHYKVWSAPYHAALLATPDSVIEKIAYTYLNPVAPHFIRKAEEWRGVSSWQAFVSGTAETAKWIRPKYVGPLPNAQFTARSIRSLMDGLEDLPCPSYNLNFEPFAWKECFSETRASSNEQLRNDILVRIREGEGRYERERRTKKINVIGAEAMAQQNVHKRYKPAKFGRRVYCICSCPVLRKQLIEMYREFCNKCEAAWNAWKRGEFGAKYPPGAFLPPRPPPANVPRLIFGHG